MEYYTIGLDFGTNSLRCLIVDIGNGKELASTVIEYENGDKGIIIDPADHNLARQNPTDYINSIKTGIRAAVIEARSKHETFSADRVIGIGVDTTGSTPLPVDRNGTPLSVQDRFKNNPNAFAWLWKDHTAHEEAGRITELAERTHPEYLAKCGGTYSSEWFFSKILHCLNVDLEVYSAAYTWLECCDYIPAVLCGIRDPDQIKRSRCAAGHKAMFNQDWGGLPSKEFLNRLDPRLGELRDRLFHETFTSDEAAGRLTAEWGQELGLPAGIPVAVGAFDAHLGGVGSGVGKGKLVKIIGTSTCDVMVKEKSQDLTDIPGLCGIVDGSVLPGYYGLEAGQSAVGDIFNWFVESIRPGGCRMGSHETLSAAAGKLKPGQSGLLALDWNNGNRTVLVDQRLTGLLVGQTLHTKPEEIYRALVEGTAFGALTIINRLEEYGVAVEEVINCGGIAEKNPLVMQIYADICGREMKISRSAQTCALGAAIAAAVAAGPDHGGFSDFQSAQAGMCATRKLSYKPIAANHRIYKKLYSLYRQLHDGFAKDAQAVSMGNIMKDLLAIKDQAAG